MLRHRISNQAGTLLTDRASLINAMDERKVHKKRCSKYLSWKVPLVFIIIIFLIVYLVIPIAFKTSTLFRNSLLFMNKVNFQIFMNVSNPQEYGLNCTRSFTISSSDGIQLGAWHIYPSSRVSDCLQGSPDERSFDDDRPVFLYFHGNGGTRGGFHRLKLYELLAYSKLDSHVVAIDYRGFGDSHPAVSPNIPGVVDDALSAYKWLMQKVSPNRTVLWTHSLGTSLGLNVINKLEKNLLPKTLVLEAPFSNLPDAIRFYPLSKVYSYFPFFDYFFVQPMTGSPSEMLNSEVNIRTARTPILILHAEDDGIVPVFLGEKLYQSALDSKDFSANNTQIVIFKGNLGYGHKHICRDPHLVKIIQEKVFRA